MGFDFVEPDTALSALGQVPDNAAELARTYAGTLGSLREVDVLLAELAQGVAVTFRAAARPAPKPPAQAPTLKAPPSATHTQALEARPAAPPAAPSLQESAVGAAKPTASPKSAPQSEEIALSEPISAERPSTGEAPRSGSYALEGFEDEGDADFEAEFAALAAPLARPEKAPASARGAADRADAEPNVGTALDPVSGPLEEALDNAPLALVDLPDPVPLAPLAAAPARQEASSRPSKAAAAQGLRTEPSAARDPDAEFDALFADATSPSSVPLASALESEAQEDSVDDLLRDLGSPRVPQELSSPDAEFAAALGDDLEAESHTLESGAAAEPLTQSDNPFPTEEELASSEFEIVLDDDAPQQATDKPAPKARPPQPPPPAAGDKRPSFLGRLFGPKKD
jgi:hypothetical protein